jgi:hypothetical protein
MLLVLLRHAVLEGYALMGRSLRGWMPVNGVSPSVQSMRCRLFQLADDDDDQQKARGRSGEQGIDSSWKGIMIGGVDHWQGLVYRYRCKWSGDLDHRSSFPRNQVQSRVESINNAFENRLSTWRKQPCS